MRKHKHCVLQKKYEELLLNAGTCRTRIEFEDACFADAEMLLCAKTARSVVAVPALWRASGNVLLRILQKKKRAYALDEEFTNSYFVAERRAMHKRREEMKAKTITRQMFYQNVRKDYLREEIEKLLDTCRTPRLLRFGESPLETSPLETTRRTAVPGVYSKKLSEALAAGTKSPLVARMQRFGIPKAYRKMIVPGVNARIPERAEWGNAEKQWGFPCAEYRDDLAIGVLKTHTKYEDSCTARAAERPKPKTKQKTRSFFF